MEDIKSPDSRSGVSTGRIKKQKTKAFDLPEYDVAVETADIDELKKMIAESKQAIAEREAQIEDLEEEKGSIQSDF